MKKIVFATNNAHKLQEVQYALNGVYQIVSLKEIGFTDDIPEPYETLEENALTKSKTISEKFNINCFADDTGLEVEALHGAPGVYSARYAGEKCSFQDNVNKLLYEMQTFKNRKAKFRTVISLIINKKEYQFEGEVKGHISTNKTGTEGFGYDPVFIPDGYRSSFAEMSLEEKNKISHRGQAVRKLVEFLKNFSTKEKDD